MPPVVMHADVDAFYASVEQRDDPALRGRPLCVGTWVVMAASYEARAYGVRGGMPVARARRLCPELVAVEPHFAAYIEASRAVFDVFRGVSDVVQGGSMEEAFLDLRGWAAPRAAGEHVRAQVRERVGLPVTVGIARTKVLAKLASRSAKPDGLLVVEPDAELAFLHPLPVERVWGIGPASARRLHAHGVRTVGQAARLQQGELMRMLGKAAGRYVHAVASNREPSPVQRRRGRRGFGAQRALGRSRSRSPEALDDVLADLADRIATRMADTARAGRTVVLRLRFGDMSRAARSTTLAYPTGDAHAIHTAARRLLVAATPLIATRGITLLGITVTNLDGLGAANQLTLDL